MSETVWKEGNPPEKGSYLCRMDNGYIKMCFWNEPEGRWYDMWVSQMNGTVKAWTNIPI